MIEQKIGECDACGFSGIPLVRYGRASSVNSYKWLCSLCARTLTGNTIDCLETYAQQSATMQTVCYVGNAILAELRKMQEASRD